jgi:hypothetical protein
MGQAYVAYAAMVAADTPGFADAIEKRTNNPRKREAFLEELRNNPAMVRDLGGANEAIAAILDMTARDATRMSMMGDRFIADAYRLQQAGWAKAKLPTNGMGRVNSAKAWAAARDRSARAPLPEATTEAGNRDPELAADASWSPTWADSAGSTAIDPDAQAFMSRALVLAARYMTNDLNAGHLDTFGKSVPTRRCFISAKLNLDQCIAATRTSYEEAFCIGTHGLQDISRCTGWPSNAGSPKG